VFFTCRGLATLDQHAARVAAALGLAPEAARAEIAALAPRGPEPGLLVPVADLVRRLGEARADPPPPIVAIGFPSVRRAPSLRAAIASYVEDALRYGRVLDYVVADGAAEEAEAAPVRAVVHEIRARYGVAVAYAGREEKRRFAHALAARAGVDPALAGFALLGDDRLPYALGANRNALLLHGAGDLVLQIDDDTRCRLTAPPDPLPGLSFTSIDDPCELWPVPAHDDGGAAGGLGARPAESAEPAEPLSWTALPDAPFVALHEELLGRAAGSAAAAARPEGLDLAGATAMLFRRIEARGGRVRVTQTGGCGDAGTGSMAHLLRLEGRSRDRMLADEAVYLRAIRARRLLRVAPRPAVGDGTACMGMALGLDARELLPPFPPAQRNADGVFGAVVRRSFLDALFGWVPWAVEHTPPEARSASLESFREGLALLGANDILRLLVAAARVEPDRDSPVHDGGSAGSADCAGSAPKPPGRSLRALGDVLSRWGSLPLPDFEDLVRTHVIRARSLDLSLVDDALRRHRRAPAFWARDADHAVEAIRKAVERPGVGWPADLCSTLGDDAGRACFASLVRRYGELLNAWPDLWEAARAQRAEGVRLALDEGAASGSPRS
jgi:hypothetical protein